jgi:hypothetical protein
VYTWRSNKCSRAASRNLSAASHAQVATCAWLSVVAHMPAASGKGLSSPDRSVVRWYGAYAALLALSQPPISSGASRGA